MTKHKIKLSEISDHLLPLIRTNEDATVWYNGRFEVHQVYKMRGLYRISTNQGQYRNEDAELEITT